MKAAFKPLLPYNDAEYIPDKTLDKSQAVEWCHWFGTFDHLQPNTVAK